MPDELPPPPKKPGLQFGIGWLLLITTLVAVAAAGGGGLTRGTDQRAFFVIFTLVTPGLALILVGLWQQISRR